MARNLAPRRIVAGPYKASSPKTGEDDNVGCYRMLNTMVMGLNRYFWQSYSGEGDLNEPLDMVALDGTLDLSEGSNIVSGTGTLFFLQCHLGQTILGILNDQSWLLKPKRIISDTEMEVWGAPDTTISGVTGWRMSRLFPINTQRGTSLTGNAIKLDKGSYIGAGSGIFRIDGQPLNASWTLERQPSIALFDPTADTYTNFPLGMATPTGVTAAAQAGGTKKMQGGNYSLVVQAARKETGGYNLASLRVDVTIATNDMVRVTLPAMDTANGQDAWRISVTQFQQSLGANLAYLNGPWFFYQPADQTLPNVTCTDDDVSPGGGTFDIEWLDAEVVSNDTVDFVNPDDPPVEAEFVALLNAIPVWISCQGQGFATHPEATSPGPFIVPAKPSNIEAAPLTTAFSSSPPETILGVVSAQGRLYLLTFNHLQIAQSTPDPTIPILIRPFWKDGFTGPDQLVFVNGNLYGYPVAGPSRSVGDGDEIVAERDWAADVAEITQNWNPGHVLVGYDPFRDMVVFFHCADHLNEAGFWTTRMLGFGIPQNFWVMDALLSSDTQDMIVSGVATIADHMELLVGGRGQQIGPPSDGLLTEDGDFFITEDGDFLVTG